MGSSRSRESRTIKRSFRNSRKTKIGISRMFHEEENKYTQATLSTKRDLKEWIFLNLSFRHCGRNMTQMMGETTMLVDLSRSRNID